MNKNMLLAVILSVVVLYIWGEFFAPKPSGSVENSAVASGPDDQQPEPQERSDAAVAQGTAPAAKVEETAPTGELFAYGTLTPSALHEPQSGTVRGGVLDIRYTGAGGRVTALPVTGEKYREKNLDMLAALKEGTAFPEMSSPFSVEPVYGVEQAADREIFFRYEKDGLVEEKRIRLSGDYLFTVSKKIINNGSAPVLWRPALRYRSIHENKEVFSSYGKRFEFLVKPAGEGMKEPSDGDKLKEIAHGKRLEWVGINYGFFLYAVVAGERPLSVEGTVDAKQNLTQLTVAYDPVAIAPGKEADAAFTVFLGPKETRILEQAGSDLGDAANLGWFGFLAEPLLWILNFFYDFVKNYGIAIILLTILVKVLLWPLSDASYKSMAKMKKLMPKVEELKKKYKEDKETLNKEIMLLYQKEGVNPLGGCLPIFIQMPIYIALYSMLNNAVELYNAKFLPFWLTDLSEKDPYFILPVSLGAFMFLQQKMPPPQMDSQQAKIMLYVMPVMFAGFMLFLPSGLNLYILANTLLGILQQWLVNKRYG